MSASATVLYDTDWKTFAPLFDHLKRDRISAYAKKYAFSLEEEPAAFLVEPVAWSKIYKKSFLTENDLKFEDGFALDPERIAQAITPATKLVSITAPHNPTGTCVSEAGLRRIADITAGRGVMLLVDETYRELTLGDPLPIAASLAPGVS